MASTPAPPQAVNSVVSSVPRIGQDLRPPIAKAFTFSSAHAVAKQFTLDKPSDPFASDAKNTKERLKKAIGLTWAHLGISAHKEHCKEPVDWENPTVLATISGKNKKRVAYDAKVREALEIRRHTCGPGSGLNEDMGAYVKTSQWNPVFHKMAVI